MLGNNMFAYCNNNPATCMDPTGTLCVFAFMGDYRTQDILTTGGGGGGGAACGMSMIPAVQKDLKNLKKFVDNESAESTYWYLDKYGFAFYKGVPVFLVDLGDDGGGFSYGIIVLDDYYLTSIDRIDTLNHEYGHRVHMDQIGVVSYTITTAIPSLIGAGLSNAGLIDVYYYDLPWEHIADAFGGVTRDEYSSWACGAASTFWAYTMVFSIISGGI
jgi:hypothetical protein